jgi:hypothetical protein
MFKVLLNVCPLWVYFTLVCSTPFITLPYPFTSYSLFFNNFHYISLYDLPSQILCFIIFCSFICFPKFHKIFVLLQICSTYEFVYGHSWFCIYVHLLDLSFSMSGNKQALSFWVWLTSLDMMSSNCIYLSSNHKSLFLMAE